MYEVINGIVAAMILELVNKFSLLTYNTTLPGWERFYLVAYCLCKMCFTQTYAP